MAGQDLAVVGTPVDDAAVGVDLVQFIGEQQHAVQARIKGARLLVGAAFHGNAAQRPVPDVAALLRGGVEAVVGQLALQVQFRLRRADERGRHLHAHLFTLAGLEADHRACMVAGQFQHVAGQLVAAPQVGRCKRFIEPDDEIVLEVFWQRAARVARAVADDLALGGNHLDVRTLVVRVHYHVGVVGFWEGETELRGAFGGRDLGGDVGVGQVHAVVIRLGRFGLVRKPAGAVVLVEFQFALQLAGDGHDGKLPVVVHPRRRLVRLLEAAQLVGVIRVGPAMAHLARLRRPEIHAPREGDGGVRIAVGEFGLAGGAHQRIDQVHRFGQRASGGVEGGAEQQGDEQFHAGCRWRIKAENVCAQPLPPHKHHGTARRHRERPAGASVRRLRGDAAVGGAGAQVHRVQLVTAVFFGVHGHVLRHLVHVDHIRDRLETGARVARTVEMAHDHGRHLARTGVVKAQALLDVARGTQAEQGAARADRQQVAERVARPGDILRRRFDRIGPGQQGPHQRIVLAVVLFARQAGAEVIVPVRPVEAIEPVARFEAVAVQRFRPQDVEAGVEVGHALAEGVDGRTQHLHLRPFGGGGRQRQLERVDVEQGLVVVVFHVVDGFSRFAGVAGRLVAAVDDVLQLLRFVAARLHGKPAQRAGQAHLDHVRRVHQVGLGARGGAGVGVIHQAIDPALLAGDLRAAVGRAAAAHGVARAVAEGADAAAVERQLRRLHEARAVGHFAEVPAFADQVDVAARGAVDARLQRLHRGARLVAHQVEAERIDLVLHGPQLGRVDHQLGHHAVFGGRVVAAGRTLDGALRIKAVVVAGHHAVQHRLRVLAGDEGVVVHHVHAHAQAGFMQRLHHLAELDDALGAVRRIGGVAAFRRAVMVRVVAPVIAVGEFYRGDGGLLCQAIGRQAGQGGNLRQGGLAALFRHGGDVVHGQQVHVRHAGAAERRQVAHAVGVGLCEGCVLAAMGGGDGAVVDGKIAHVQLVDRHVRLRGHAFRYRRAVPAGRFQVGGIQVGDVAAPRIGGEADRIRIGDQVAHQACRGRDHIHHVLVVAAREFALQLRGPDAGGGVARHGRDGGRFCSAAFVGAHRHAQVRRLLRAGVQVVQRAGQLHAGGVQHRAVRRFAHQQHLAGEQTGNARGVRRRHRQQGTGADELEALGQRGGHRGSGRRQRQRAIGAGHATAWRCAQLRGGGVIEFEDARGGRIGRSARPLDQPAIEPVRAGVRGGRCLQDGGERTVAVGNDGGGRGRGGSGTRAGKRQGDAGEDLGQSCLQTMILAAANPLRLAVVIHHLVPHRVQREQACAHQRERGKEEHLECPGADAGAGDLRAHRVVLDARVHDQHPQVADRRAQVPKAQDDAFHGRRRLAVRKLEARGRHQHFAQREQHVRQQLPEDADLRRGRDADGAHQREQRHVIQRDQQHHQNRIDRLHLRRQQREVPAEQRQLRTVHGVGLHDPGGRLLVEQRPEGRDQREHDQDAQHRAHAFHRFGRVQAARAVQLHRHAAAAKGQQQHQRRARGDHKAPLRDHAQRDGGGDCAGAGHHQARARLAGRLRQQGGAGHAAERIGIRCGRRHVDVFFAAEPEHIGGNCHQHAGNAEGDRRAVVAQQQRHQQRREERAEIDDPVKGVEYQLGAVFIGLVELVAHERHDQRLDAARAERDQRQSQIKAVEVMFEDGQARVAGHVDQRKPEHRVVLAEVAVGQPAAQQREKVHADDEGVENVLGFAGAVVDGNEQQQRAQ
uniref:Uncharacterized protein n=1 Tax=Tanacetum cinerariifolium TaxID=118510 RepID=A0A699GFG5_TANCI|nr:hypothetical protein [Tanacetum cinerariifolium]